jgi:aspartyl-tRNA(Asn)/glutamyl-tRNA(Gln) amidotransferase subunit A
MHNKTITELAKGLRAKEYSSVELTQFYLDRINKHQSLNCFISVAEEHALKQAKIADTILTSADASLLTGIPIAQ